MGSPFADFDERAMFPSRYAFTLPAALMAVLPLTLPALFAPFLSFAAAGPPEGRQAALIRRGLELMEQERYADAANLLEEAWETDSSDPLVTENLAICLLHGRKDRAGAFRLMRDALARGGRAGVVVEHIHERAVLSAGIVSDTCKGRLYVQKSRIHFVSAQPEHSFAVTAGEVKELKRNRALGASQGAFHLETVKGRKINLRPADWSAETTELIFRLWEMASRNSE